MGCPRTIVRHIGPPGPGLPPGGTPGQIAIKASGDDYDVIWGSTGAGLGDVVGPASSVTNRLAAFTDNTGKLIKDSGILISEIFTTTAANNKVDKVSGKELSSNDFTNAYKTKLDNATAENFRGEFATLLALTTAIPAGLPGDYANVVTLGNDAIQYIWDNTNAVWSSLNDAAILDGQEIADLIYNATDSPAWSQVDNRIFTQANKDALDGAASLTYVNSLALAAGVLTPAYSAMAYFDLTGTSVAIVGISDGVSNLVKAAPTTTLDAASIEFDSPAAARLRYTGTATRLFVVTYSLSLLGTASAQYVVTLSKNGSYIPVSRTLVSYGATPNTTSVSATVLVSLSTNDFLEIFIGNTTDTNDPTVKTLSLEASPA